jgi:uncharacterized membrane protein
MNPFDLKSALLAKHAQHVVLVHVPIALFIVGVAFDIAARWTRRHDLEGAAYYNLMIAAVSTIPVIATGILAWQFALEGQRVKGILLMHMVMAFVSTAIIWFAWWLHWRARKGQATRSRVVLVLEVVGVAAIALTGHLGGFLSGVNAPG